MRRPTIKRKPRKVQMMSFPAATGGLIRNRNLAQARQTGAGPGAHVMLNCFPTPTGVVIRNGCVLHAEIGEITVKSLFTYSAGSLNQMFAADDEGIWNVSTSTPASVLAGQTSGDWSVVQFSTTGGEFLIGVNGVDDGFIYDGTSFDPLTITGVDTEDLAFVWAYKERLYFIEKDSLDVWYLDVDAITGAATKLPMVGVFTRGGNLLFGQPWSLGTGAEGGLSEQIVFVTDQGEVAVFQGLSPEDTQTWGKVGLYRIGRPLGRKGFIRAGGDLVIATSIGFLSLARSVQLDYAAMAVASLSYPVEEEWSEAVARLGLNGWTAEIWPEGQMIVVAPFVPVTHSPVLLVANATTGAWSMFSGWNVQCMTVFQGRLYFGSTDGRVIQAYVTGADMGLPFQMQYLPLFDDLDTPGNRKVARMARGVVRAVSEVNVGVQARFDFNADFPAPPAQALAATGNEWESGIWGESIWDAETPTVLSQEWQSVGGSGYAASVAVQLTSGRTVPLRAELVRVDLTFETADVVT